MDDLLTEAQERWLSDEAVDGLSYLLDAHEELREKYEKKKERLGEASEKVVEFMRFKSLFEQSEIDGEATIEHRPLSAGGQLEYMVYIDRPDDFKDVVDLFYEAGLRQRKDSKERIGETYHDFLVRRKYYLKNEDRDVLLHVYVKVVGDDCERVKVGEEIKTEDVYEIRCD